MIRLSTEDILERDMSPEGKAERICAQWWYDAGGDPKLIETVIADVIRYYTMSRLVQDVGGALPVLR